MSEGRLLGKFLWKAFRPIFILVLQTNWGFGADLEGIWGKLGGEALEDIISHLKDVTYSTLKTQFYIKKSIALHQKLVSLFKHRIHNNLLNIHMDFKSLFGGL